MKILIGDLETIKSFFLAGFYNPQEDSWVEFRINEYQNDLYEFIKYCEDYKEWYQVYFNGLKFDSQIIEYIFRNYENWGELSGKEIAFKIWKFSQVVIDLTNNEEFPPYSENQCGIKQIDAFEVPHFSNKARRCSLKWLEFMMDAPNIEEMPYPHYKESFTEAEVEEMVIYWKNDIIELHRWWKYLTGDVSHEFYKGKNKIQDRVDLIAEGLLPERAMSYSDSKIGDELNKSSYCRLTGKSLADLYILKKSRTGTKKFTYGQAIPSYVQFTTPELKQYFNKIKDVVVSLVDTDKQEFPITFRGTTYSIMRGGIHSQEKNRVVKPKDDEYCRDADVGAQYPNAIKKRLLFPYHLGVKWNDMASENIVKKDYYKQKQKEPGITDALKRKNKGLEGTYKLAMNAGLFGKTIDRTNWQYGPEVGYYCTIGNQFEILMLIEMLELEGIHCISANTDGIVCLFKKDLNDKYYEICHKWEEIVGNTVMGKLEYTDFKVLAQESINHYVAVGSDGKVKIKGRFETEGELHKNNTDKVGRIERKAIVKYFSEGVPIETTIRSSTNIFDFCIGVKSSRNYHFETLNTKTNTFTQHKKIVRFFISKDGEKLVKIKNEEADTNGADLTRIANGHLVTIFNRSYTLPMEEYKIDYDYYIQNAEEIMKKIEGGRQNKKYVEPPKEQLNLFN